MKIINSTLTDLDMIFEFYDDAMAFQKTVFDKQWLIPIAQVLQQLGSQHVLIVHSEDGLDEISLSAKTYITELKDGVIRDYEITPEQFGFQSIEIEQLAVNSVEDSLDTLHSVLDNVSGPALDIVCLNAGAAIYTAGLSEDIESGIKKALSVIADGSAKGKLNKLIEVSQSFN